MRPFLTKEERGSEEKEWEKEKREEAAAELKEGRKGSGGVGNHNSFNQSVKGLGRKFLELQIKTDHSLLMGHRILELLRT